MVWAWQNEAKTKPICGAKRAVCGRAGFVNRLILRGKAEFLGGFEVLGGGRGKITERSRLGYYDLRHQWHQMKEDGAFVRRLDVADLLGSLIYDVVCKVAFWRGVELRLQAKASAFVRLRRDRASTLPLCRRSPCLRWLQYSFRSTRGRAARGPWCERLRIDFRA